MPLIEMIRQDPQVQRASLQQEFNELPASDKQNVIKMIEMGRSGAVTEGIELTEEGQEFVLKPEFKAIYEQKVQPAPQPQAQSEGAMMPLISGLMDIIRQQAHVREPVPHGHLKPEYGERLGGKQDGHVICKACGK
jgi:hypothetical protein